MTLKIESPGVGREMLIARILIVIATIKVPLSKAAVYKWSSTGEQIKTDWRAASDEKHRGTGIVRHFGKNHYSFSGGEVKEKAIQLQCPL